MRKNLHKTQNQRKTRQKSKKKSRTVRFGKTEHSNRQNHIAVKKHEKIKNKGILYKNTRFSRKSGKTEKIPSSSKRGLDGQEEKEASVGFGHEAAEGLCNDVCGLRAAGVRLFIMVAP